jgi:hypothetical protein
MICQKPSKGKYKIFDPYNNKVIIIGSCNLIDATINNNLRQINLYIGKKETA